MSTDLQQPGEHAVPVGHELVPGPGARLLGQLGDDEPQGGEGLVDVGPLLQPLAHSSSLDGPLAPGEVHQADPAHLEDKCLTLWSVEERVDPVLSL